MRLFCIIKERGEANMKFCPKCGQMLDDDALICSRCGATQSSNDTATSYNKASFNESTTSVSTPMNQGGVANIKSEFDALYNSNEKFRDLYKQAKLKALLGFFNILVLPLFLIVMLMSYAFLNGKNVGDPSLVSQSSFPIGLTLLNFFKYNDIAWSSKVEAVSTSLGPDQVNTAAAMMLPFVIAAGTLMVFGMFTTIVSKKAFYNMFTQNEARLTKSMNRSLIFIPGAIALTLLIIPVIISNSLLSGLVYTRTYALGEIEPNQSFLVAGLITYFVSLLVMVAGPILINAFLLKPKVSKYL